MFGRINFLFAVSALIIISFYIVGRFILLEAIMRLAPAAAPYFVAAFVLSALMLTVLALAKTVIRLESTSVAARQHHIGPTTIIGQSAICIGHVFVVWGLYTFYSGAGLDGNWLLWVIAIVFYLAGTIIAIADWRKRALSVSV